MAAGIGHTPIWMAGGGTSHVVALEVLINGPISRSEIARSLELSAGTLTRLTAPLIADGLLVETGELTGGHAGRPARLLDVVPGSHHFIGLKITADEVIGVVTDLRANVLASGTLPLSDRTPEATVTVVGSLVRSLGDRVDAVTGIGVGIGGLIANSRRVIRAPFLQWNDVDLATLLEEETAIPTVIENDVTAFTEYEHWFGAARHCDRFAVVTLGAGLGYGLVASRRLVVSEDSGIGLVGHWPLDPFGPVCPSGHRGCAMSVLTQSAITSSASSSMGSAVRYDEVLEMASAGVPAIRRIVDDAGLSLGHFLAAVANLTMPELIVLGGEGVGLARVAHEAIQAGIAERRDPFSAPISLALTQGNNSEWCRGAAVIAIQTYVLGTKGHGT